MKDKASALVAMKGANSFTEAARAAGIDRRTLFGWLRDDSEFCKAFQAMRQQAALERAEAAEADRQAALNVVRGIMADDSQSGLTRLKAAASVLENADKIRQAADMVIAAIEFEQL